MSSGLTVESSVARWNVTLPDAALPPVLAALAAALPADVPPDEDDGSRGFQFIFRRRNFLGGAEDAAGAAAAEGCP